MERSVPKPKLKITEIISENRFYIIKQHKLKIHLQKKVMSIYRGVCPSIPYQDNRKTEITIISYMIWTVTSNHQSLVHQNIRLKTLLFHFPNTVLFFDKNMKLSASFTFTYYNNCIKSLSNFTMRQHEVVTDEFLPRKQNEAKCGTICPFVRARCSGTANWGAFSGAHRI